MSVVCVAGVGSDVCIAGVGSDVCIAGVVSDICGSREPHPSDTILPMAPMRTIERIRVIIDVIPLFKIEVSSHPLRRITRLSFPQCCHVAGIRCIFPCLGIFREFQPGAQSLTFTPMPPSPPQQLPLTSSCPPYGVPGAAVDSTIVFRPTPGIGEVRRTSCRPPHSLMGLTVVWMLRIPCLRYCSAGANVAAPCSSYTNRNPVSDCGVVARRFQDSIQR